MKKILDKVIPLCFVLPYMEINLIREALEYANGYANFPASLVFLIVIGAVYFLANTNKNVWYFRHITVAAIMLHFYLFMRMLFAILDSKYEAKVLVFQYIWFVIPFWYAMTIANYIIMRNLDIKHLIKRCCWCYLAYTVFCVTINIKNYGLVFSITGTNTQRIISTGGGPVILGYSIALVLALIFLTRPFEKKRTELLMMMMLVIVALFTGSRGGIWPSIMLLIFMFLTNTERKINYPVLLLTILAILLINPWTIIRAMFPRIADIDENGRLSTIINGLSVFGELDLGEWLFGTGLGNLFPYQKYCNYHIIGENTFFIYGIEMLVQPHNTYIYLLLETGIVGLAMYIVLLGAFFKTLYRNQDMILSGMFWGIFIVLGLVESTVLINPGSAGLWWLIMFLACIARKQICDKPCEERLAI